MKKTLFLTIIFLLPLFGSGEASNVPQQETKVLVCTGKYAKRYHSHKCRGLKSCKGEILTVTLAKAKKDGYTPCGYCYK
jgi:hypothetical protein